MIYKLVSDFQRDGTMVILAQFTGRQINYLVNVFDDLVYRILIDFDAEEKYIISKFRSCAIDNMSMDNNYVAYIRYPVSEHGRVIRVLDQFIDLMS